MFDVRLFDIHGRYYRTVRLDFFGGIIKEGERFFVKTGLPSDRWSIDCYETLVVEAPAAEVMEDPNTTK